MSGRGASRRAWENPWFWGVGGCCLGCIGLPLAFVAIFGVGMAALFNQGSDLYEAALVALRSSPEAVEQLGEPIKKGWLIQGNLNFDNGEGKADISFPVSGPEGSGRLHVDGRREEGVWTFERLELVLDDGRTLPIPPPP